MLLFIVTFRFWLLVVAIVASVILFSYFYKKWEERRLRREVLNILSYLPLTDTENDFDFDSDNTMYVPLHDIFCRAAYYSRQQRELHSKFQPTPDNRRRTVAYVASAQICRCRCRSSSITGLRVHGK